MRDHHSHVAIPYAARSIRAFTLVELLVVIGIIAVLIGVLLPALSKARQQSQSVACLSNMRQLGQGLVMFTQEHKGYLPKGWFNARPKVAASPSNGSDVVPSDYSTADSWGFRYPMYGWDYVMLQYVGKSKNVFACPTDTEPKLRGLLDNPEFGFDQTLLTDKPEADDIPASYRINLSDLTNRAYDAMKITQIKRPSLAIMFLEGADKDPAIHPNPQDAPYHHVATWEDESEGKVGPPNLNPATNAANRKNVAWNRHNKRANYVFADGHAESLVYEDTWKPIGPQWSGSTNINFYHPQTMWRQRYEAPPASSYRAGDAGGKPFADKSLWGP
jgi:prepilin-type processing-associated H-X9-DG protein/prepilin-type N-terminal cleavage/methylation domain-containing protein